MRIPFYRVCIKHYYILTMLFTMAIDNVLTNSSLDLTNIRLVKKEAFTGAYKKPI